MEPTKRHSLHCSVQSGIGISGADGFGSVACANLIVLALLLSL